eukprot:m.235618 g.235618  ORF g.235618 m.235618 type:complete len:105 (-) comp12853_c0_seq1:1834-2148(-)
MAGRLVAFHNVHIPGLVPTLHKFLGLSKFQDGKVLSLILGRKREVQKLKVGMHIDVVAPSEHGLKLIARNGHSIQEMVLVSSCTPTEVQGGLDYVLGRKNSLDA